MREQKKNKLYSPEIFCPVFPHKIHCSQVEGTQASLLPKEKRYEFCVNKCLVYKIQKENMSKEEIKLVYQDRALKITRYPGEKGYKYKIDVTSGPFSKCWEEYFSEDEEAIRSAKQKFTNLYRKLYRELEGKSNGG